MIYILIVNVNESERKTLCVEHTVTDRVATVFDRSERDVIERADCMHVRGKEHIFITHI